MRNMLRMLAGVLCVWLFISMVNVGSAVAAGANYPDARPGWVMVREGVLDAFNDEPTTYFYNARENFMKKDLQGAARELRKGAAFIELESSRATTEGKAVLVSSYKELNKLADDVEKGTITAAKDFDEVFARAHQALAKHHYLKALEAQGKKDVTMTGRFMESALIHLEDGFAWSGHKLEAGSIAALRDTRLLSGKLIKGIGWVPEEVGKAITWIGNEIRKLGDKIS